MKSQPTDSLADEWWKQAREKRKTGESKRGLGLCKDGLAARRGGEECGQSRFIGEDQQFSLGRVNCEMSLGYLLDNVTTWKRWLWGPAGLH